jgi:hypothetical protein
MILTIVYSKFGSPENFNSYIQIIRRYKKLSTIRTGAKVLWSVYKSFPKESITDNEMLICAYGSKIVTIALATANEYRNNELDLYNFVELCKCYLSIKDEIIKNDEFLFEESEKILNNLKEISENDIGIPNQYLKKENIYNTLKKISERLWFSRCNQSQANSFRLFGGLNDFYTAYEIIKQLDQLTKGKVLADLKKINIDPINFLVSGLNLLAIAQTNDGFIDLKNINIEENHKSKFDIDEDTCYFVASRISFDESQLKELFKNKILTLPNQYQKYFTNIFTKNPIIHLNSLNNDRKFIIACPFSFIRYFPDKLLGQLVEFYKQNRKSVVNTFCTRIGDAWALHIQKCLEFMFPNNDVIKLDTIKKERNGLRIADFYIKLEKYNLIIEVKSGIGSYDSLSLMLPEHVASLWSRLYEAYEQCSSTIREYKDNKNPVISLVLICDSITNNDLIPFHVFVQDMNILKDLGFDFVNNFIDIMPWNEFEYRLSKTNIEDFITAIIEKWSNVDSTLDVLQPVRFTQSEKSQHQYQYLKDTEKLLLKHLANFLK